MIRIYLKESNERVALLISDALAVLTERFAMTLTGTICGKKLRPLTSNRVEKSGLKGISDACFCSLRIVVYGKLMHNAVVAETLGKADLFLQHPGETEIDHQVKYLNPQYLLPPGEEMPPLENLSISTCCAGRITSATSNTACESERAEVYRIFDTAVPDGIIKTIEPSPRLSSMPKRYAMLPMA